MTDVKINFSKSTYALLLTQLMFYILIIVNML